MQAWEGAHWAPSGARPTWGTHVRTHIYLAPRAQPIARPPASPPPVSWEPPDIWGG